MAHDAIDRCKACGTPYLSALKDGETDADRICYTCHPAGPSKAKTTDDADDELVLAENDNEPKRFKHAHGDARQQIVKQIRSSAKKVEENELPADAPELPARRRYVSAEKESSGLGFFIKALALVAVIVTAGIFAFQTISKSQQDSAQKAAEKEAPPIVVPPPEPPAPIPVAPPQPKQTVVKAFRPDNVDVDDFKPPVGAAKAPGETGPHNMPAPDSKLPNSPKTAEKPPEMSPPAQPPAHK